MERHIKNIRIILGEPVTSHPMPQIPVLHPSAYQVARKVLDRHGVEVYQLLKGEADNSIAAFCQKVLLAMCQPYDTAIGHAPLVTVDSLTHPPPVSQLSGTCMPVQAGDMSWYFGRRENW